MKLTDDQTKIFYDFMGVDLDVAKDLTKSIVNLAANKEFLTILCALSKTVGLVLSHTDDVDFHERFFQENLKMAIEIKKGK